ncbi:hypothetical protein KCP75_20060 [Salmonella enterica subsp. enterica]|nr:hypothetical protein KCP75_20060 [Salmonella enterica subsp. enterica]
MKAQRETAFPLLCLTSTPTIKHAPMSGRRAVYTYLEKRKTDKRLPFMKLPRLSRHRRHVC